MSKRILALDIGTSAIKLGEFEPLKDNQIRMLNYRSSELAESLCVESGINPSAGGDAGVVAVIREILQQIGMARLKTVVNLPSRSVFYRFITIPPLSISRIDSVIEYEARENVPFPLNEVIWDCQLIGESSAAGQAAMILAVKREFVERVVGVVKTAGLDPIGIESTYTALANSLHRNYAAHGGCTMLLDIGAWSTTVVLIDQKKVFCRSLPYGGESLTKIVANDLNLSFPEAGQMKRNGCVPCVSVPDVEQSPLNQAVRLFMTRLHVEVERALKFYQSQFGMGGTPPTRVLLAGGGSLIPYADVFFQEKLRVPVEWFNPFQNVDWNPQLSADELSTRAPVLGTMVGLGLRLLPDCPFAFDLLHGRKTQEEKKGLLARLFSTPHKLSDSGDAVGSAALAGQEEKAAEAPSSPSLQRPNRNRARELSDEGTRLAAVNVAQARAKWIEAITADPSWSVSYFNLALSFLNGGDPDQAEHYLNEAATHAEVGSSSEDSQVLQQVKTMRVRITANKELVRRGRQPVSAVAGMPTQGGRLPSPLDQQHSSAPIISIGMDEYTVNQLLGKPRSRRSGAEIMKRVAANYSVIIDSDLAGAVTKDVYAVYDHPAGSYQLVFRNGTVVAVHAHPGSS